MAEQIPDPGDSQDLYTFRVILALDAGTHIRLDFTTVPFFDYLAQEEELLDPNDSMRACPWDETRCVVDHIMLRPNEPLAVLAEAVSKTAMLQAQAGLGGLAMREGRMSMLRRVDGIAEPRIAWYSPNMTNADQQVREQLGRLWFPKVVTIEDLFRA